MNPSELIYLAFHSLFNSFGVWLLLDAGHWEDVGSSVPGRKLGSALELGFGSQAPSSQGRAALPQRSGGGSCGLALRASFGSAL